MIQYLKDWVNKPYDENAKKIVRDFTIRILRVMFWIFIFVILLIIVAELDKIINISEFFGITCESNYTDEKCSK